MVEGHITKPLIFVLAYKCGPISHVWLPSTNTAAGIVKTGTLAPGITVLSDGANVVGPGSIHPSGHFYEWDDFHSPATIPLADPPLWLLDVLQAQRLYTCRTAAPATARQASKGTVRSLLASSALDHAAKGMFGSLDGAAVKSLFGQWEVVQRCLKVLGLAHVRVGEKFNCIIHPGSASLGSDSAPTHTDRFLRVCGFSPPGGRALYCAVAAAVLLPDHQGIDGYEPAGTELFSCLLRLLAEAGVIDGVPIPAPKLKGHVPQDAQRVYVGFIQLS